MKTAVVFPGQGAQSINMGREIAEQNPLCMRYWEEAEEYSSLNLRKIYWEEHDAHAMMQTSAVQPALTAVALSLLHISQDSIHASYYAGHSLGEFPALYASKVLSSTDVLRLTALRGMLMQNADKEEKGGMLAVLKLPVDVVQSIVQTIQKETNAMLIIANYNTPTQSIISGEKSIFPRIIEAISAQKGRAIPLQVSGAFHSPMMQDAENSFKDILTTVTWHDATIPFYSNTTATPLTKATEIQHAISIQMTSPVRWVDIVENMTMQGVNRYIELGTKSVLASLIKASLSTTDAIVKTISSVEDCK